MAHKNISDMEDLENIGWGQMSSILNKEMPIKKKGKRVLIWWLSGAAAAIIALLIGFPIQNDSSKNIISQQLPNPSISEKTIEREIQSNTETNADLIKTEPITPSTSKNQTKPQFRTKENGTNSKTNNSSSKLNPVPLKNILQELKEYKDQAIISQSIEANKSNIFSNYTKETFSLNPISIPTDISNLSNHIFIKVPPIDLSSVSKFTFGLQVHYGNSPQKKYAELGIGLTGSWGFNTRWSLISSLNFQRRNNLFASQSFDLLETADALFSNTGGQLSTPDPGQRSYSSANEIKLSQLALQLGMQYQLSPNWAINGSIIPSYSFINVNQYNEWYFEPITRNLSPNVAFDGFTVPKKWNAHIDLGLKYAINDQYFLGLNYSYLATREGISTLVEPNFESDEWRFTVQYLLD